MLPVYSNVQYLTGFKKYTRSLTQSIFLNRAVKGHAFVS